MKKTFLILLLLAFIFSFAQEIGMFFMQNYAPKEYQADSQNWSIVQDQRGIMYFANDKGVLEYDGKNWHLISIKNESAVHSLAIDSTGVIYVGASGEFGYLEPDSLGEMKYHSLIDKLPEKDKNFADVWTTITTNEAVFFQTDNFLLRFNKEGTKLWYPESYFFLAFCANETVFVHDFTVGLKTLQEDKLILGKIGKTLAKERIYTLLSFDKEHFLVGTRGQGLLTFNPKKDTVLTKFENEAEDFLLNNNLYNGHKLNQDLFAFATRKGVVVLDKNGKVKDKFDKKAGLRDENIRAIYPNQERTLWLGLDNGLASIEIISPIRFWGEENGISGAIYDIIKFENTVYVATSNGVFYLENNRFQLVKNSPTKQCWTFAKNYGGFLLVGTNEGIYKIENKTVTELQKTNSAVVKLHNFKVLNKYEPNQSVWVGQKQGLGRLTFDENGQVNFQDSIANIPYEIHSIYEQDSQNIWLGTFFNGVIKLEVDRGKYDKFGTKNGLPNLRDIHIHNVGNQLAFTTSKGLYRFDGKNKFTRDSLGMSFWADTTQGIFDLKKDDKDNIWLADFDTKDNPIGLAQKQNDGQTYIWQNTALQRLPQITKPVLYIDDDSMIWIGGNQGLFRYDPKIPKKYKQKFYTVLRKVKAGDDLILLNGNQFANLENHFLGIQRVAKPQIVNEKQIIDYQNSSLIFEFVAPYFEEESEIEYSTFLEGYDKHWTSWTKENKKEYGNLWEGNYTFRTKARNTFGIESTELVYHFKVLPPWYRSIWAKVSYVILAILLVLGIVRAYSYRLKQQNKILEQAVQLRTVELEQQKEEVLVQAENLKQANEEISAINDELNTKNKEVELKRKEITDSISYASRIQGAMLPTLDSIAEGLPNSFILYKPRDIVSGDFYWFSETEPEPVFGLQMTPEGRQSVFKGFTRAKQIISAVDCTGHGVPGAFMSMIGETYLKQIISSESIISPERILNELHKKIRTALKQKEGNNRDGMDMTVCVIDRDKKVIEFAGARNPIVYVQNNELKVIKGDIFPIGGASYEEDEERLFTKHEIPLESDIIFYLFSDGYQDQFGGPNGKKFMKRKFYDLLYQIHHLPTTEQKEVLDKTLKDWMKDLEQVDDILVLGVKVKI